MMTDVFMMSQCYMAFLGGIFLEKRRNEIVRHVVATFVKRFLRYDSIIGDVKLANLGASI